MNIIKQAEKFVDDYAKGKFKRAFVTVEKERHGLGCGCPVCKKQAIDEVNSWAQFLAGDQDIPEYQIDENGNIDLR